jgi:hypothetical protein
MAALEQIEIPRPHEQNDPNEENNMPAEDVERAQQHDEAINYQVFAVLFIFACANCLGTCLFHFLDGRS